jgi:hypothetical protein
LLKFFCGIAGFFVVFFLVAQAPSPAAAGVVPENVRRPIYFENPVYPRDLSIGDLGTGEASHNAYGYVRRVLLAVQRSDKSSALLSSLPSNSVDNIIAELEKISPRKFRIGGGQIGVEGSHSFLFRFIGRESEITGSIYVREAENPAGGGGAWALEDIMLEAPRSIEEARTSDNTYLWLPYDRMY